MTIQRMQAGRANKTLAGAKPGYHYEQRDVGSGKVESVLVEDDDE